MSKKQWHYADAATSKVGKMICTACTKPILAGLYRYRETEDAYLPQHKACSSSDPRWSVLDACDEHRAAFAKRRAGAYARFVREFGEPDDLIGSDLVEAPPSGGGVQVDAAREGGDQLLGMYAVQADEIKALLDEYAPDSTGNIKARIQQVLSAPTGSAAWVLLEEARGVLVTANEKFMHKEIPSAQIYEIVAKINAALTPQNLCQACGGPTPCNCNNMEGLG